MVIGKIRPNNQYILTTLGDLPFPSRDVIGQTRCRARPRLGTHQPYAQLGGVLLFGQHEVAAPRLGKVPSLGQVHRLTCDRVLTFVLHFARRQRIGLAGLAH